MPERTRPSGDQVQEAMLGPVAYWIGCFVLGGIPFALLIGKAKGIDIREVGSRNIGATNLGRSLGLSWGVLAFFLDAGKGLVAVLVGSALLRAEVIGGSSSTLVIGAAAAIFGHCYPVYLRFRGGKGVATAAGALCGLHPLLCAVLLGVWVVVVGLTRTIGVGSCAAAIVACLIGTDFAVGSNLAPIEGTQSTGMFLIVLGGLVLFRHRSNIRDYFTPNEAGSNN